MKRPLIHNIFFVLGLMACTGALAQELPGNLKALLEKAQLPERDIGIWIAPAGKSRAVFSHNAGRIMRPASTIKVATTLAALELLGPAYCWKSRWLSRDEPDAKGRVRDLTFVGSGDPHYVIERLWLAAQRLRCAGVRIVEGDIGVDRQLFDVPAEAVPADGQTMRAYNVAPDAALINMRTLNLEIKPEFSRKRALITPMPFLSRMKVTPSVPLSEGACVDWRGHLKAVFSKNRIRLTGTYPASCGEKLWPLVLEEPNTYLQTVFTEVFSQAGIRWKGKVKDVQARATAHELLKDPSEPLSRLIVLTNKFSNNPMARHLFLSLSFADEKKMTAPATLTRSRAVLAQWLNDIGIDALRVFVDNGSGLSQMTSICTQDLGRIVAHGLQSPLRAEFIASLPLSGIDGTMRKRAVRGLGHLKTGRVNGVRSIAGLVEDERGGQWAVCIIINTKQADHTEDVIDGILDWVGSGALANLTAEPPSQGLR